jgi:glycosyltransferase involved in cell wall biosynthesis
MCAMSGKPRCAAAGLAVHTAGEAELLQSVRHFRPIFVAMAPARPDMAVRSQSSARKTHQLAVYQPICAILGAPRAAASALGRAMTGPVQALVEQVLAFAEQRGEPDPLLRRRIAVLIPCYNEEAAIATVVADFRKALPEADIYVYDNNSHDRTVEIARDAGAIVRSETLQGKGRVVRRMFAEIEADIYILVDGDATYDAPSARAMAARIVTDRLDMVVGARVDQDKAAYRRGHRFGNRILTAFVADVFGKTFTDILSGYRAFSRRFVKSFPALSGGFEIETELTVHALELELPVAEIETPYYARPEGSHSKLNTWRDGVRILSTIVKLYRSERPLGFFSGIGISMAIMSVGFAIPIVITYLREGVVPRLPTAVLSTGLMIIAALAITCGLVLDTVTRGRREIKLLAYLAQRAPGEGRRDA